jgi:class 3 adenylate cyclase
MTTPETRFATIGNDRVAYQVAGEGPRDLVFSSGQWGHVDLEWEEPAIARFYRRLASFSRLIRFDTRGSALSDPRPRDGREPWEHWMEDLLAVMDAAGSNTTAIVGFVDSGSLALQFAAAHPKRVSALVLVNTQARIAAAPDYPEGHPSEVLDQFLEFSRKYYGTERWARASNPSLASDERALRWLAKWHRAAGSPRVLTENFENQQKMDARAALSRIRAPTLVMMRNNYRWVPVPQGRYIAEHIAGAHFVEIPGKDSLPFWETPDLILDHIEEFVTGQRHGGEPDRVLTTVLFTDIVGSTDQAAKLGDAAWRALLDRHDNTLRAQVGLFGGKVADHAGDGSLSTFENPRRAIECALTLRNALAAIGVEIRAGVHFGEVERRAGGAVSGVGVHIGARVMALANAGEVLISRTVRDILLGSRFRFDEGRTSELKGVPGQWTVYLVAEQEEPHATQPGAPADGPRATRSDRS